MLVDSHCHLDLLDLSGYRDGIDGALVAAADAGVDTLLCVSVSADNVEQVVAIARDRANVYATVGTHPLEVIERPIVADRLAELARDDKVIGIGETGLDYHYDREHHDHQRDSFRDHLELAIEVDKPVIVHTRDAADDTLDLLAQFAWRGLRGVLHCFTGDWPMARAALDLGLYISLSGIVTFASAGALRDVARRIPAERLLIETDSPWLAPVPYRGRSNEPRYLPAVAQCVATERGIDADRLAALTRQNFAALFRVDIDAATG